MCRAQEGADDMEGFTITKLCEGAYNINDAHDDSFYVVIGEKLARVIDTGVTEGARITPVIREITDRPLVLVVTHAHFDHMYHMDEFDTVYMSHKELTLKESFLENMKHGKDIDFAKTVDISTDSVIDLGGVTLSVCDLAGHTPGSVIILDETHGLLFTGDAIGSGCGVWMQVSSSVSLDKYYAALKDAFAWLVKKGGRMAFWGGHNKQVAQSEQVPGFNPLSMGLLADLIDLVDLVRNGKLEYRPVDGNPGSDKPVAYAAWGRAEMLFSPDAIHSDNMSE
ncbi:MAG: MBL fold metallo-hydrolase [Oscillospiraceae bacterium]|nr:MBL fold metallo-hydrolase [Oscillospiraceae bacterium]